MDNRMVRLRRVQFGGLTVRQFDGSSGVEGGVTRTTFS